MMEGDSFYSYLSATGGYFLLFVLALFRINRNPVNICFAMAVCASLVWSADLAFNLQNPDVYVSEALFLETLSYVFWYIFLIALISQQQFNNQYAFLIKSWNTYVLLALVLIVLFLEVFSELRHITQQLFGHGFRFFTHTCLAIGGLVLIEQLYRNSNVGQRWAVKFLCLGLGGAFLISLILYSKSLLYIELDLVIWGSRGYINLLAMPLMAISLNRLQYQASATEISVSRKVVFYSTVLFATGIYLILMSLAGYYIRDYGGSWGMIAQTVFISLSILLLLIILLSGKIRAQGKVYLNKHFFQHGYNYREEWLKLSKTLAELNSLTQLSSLIIKTMADLVASSGGGLWLKNEQGHYYLADEYNLGFHSMQLIQSTDQVIQFIHDKQWVIDFIEYSEANATYEVDLSDWLSETEKIWLIVPLFRQNEMLGFVVLCKALVPRRLNWEDRDLLQTVAMQLSNALALSYVSDELSQSKQFEAYNQLSAYLVHDLKNLVAQVALIVKNAEKYKRNPDFIDDSIDTLKNVSTKLLYLVGQLKKGNLLSADDGKIDLVKIISDVVVQQAGNKPPLKPIVKVEQCNVSGDKEKMVAVIGHLVQNAQEATDDSGWVYLELSKDERQAIIKVIDNGIGMDSKFISERLFKPFDTTKGNAGMGVGVYETRDYIHKQSGQINVESTPGQGTIFTISLPLIQA